MITIDHIGCVACAVKPTEDVDTTGMDGIIRAVAHNGQFCLIEYEDDIGSDCNGQNDAGQQVAEPGWCLWVSTKYVKLKSNPFKVEVASKVQKDFEHKGTNLKGMPFRVLGYTSRGQYVVVEFEDNIKGHSGDGLGRRGHCLHVPTKVIRKER